MTSRQPALPPLQTLIVTDGKPGHYHLADGICAALARRRTLEITRLAVTRPRWMPARMLSALTNAGGMGRRAVPWALGFEERPIPQCDLIVSAGGDTLAANVALAKLYGCTNVFYGSLRRYRPDDFSLVLTSYAARAGLPRHAMTLKPSAFDPDTAPVRQPCPGEPPVTGLLIGGDSGTVRFDAADWQRLTAMLSETEHANGRWIVSNSRRTPEVVSDAIADIALGSGSRMTFVDVRKAGSGTLGALFEASSRIAVTVDSSSMISEAIWARKPVVALLPRHSGLPALEQSYRDWLAAKNWISNLPLADATGPALESACAKATPIGTNPLDDLAGLLAGRLPELRLSPSA